MLVALAVAMAAGIACADAGAACGLTAGHARVPALLGLLALSRAQWRAAAALLLAFAAGWSAMAERRAEARTAAGVAPVEGTVDAVVARRSDAWHPRWIELEGVRGVAGVRRLRLYADAPEHLDRWLPGDRLRARVRVAALGGARNPGRESGAPGLARAGIGLAGRALHPSLVVAEGAPEGVGRWLHARRRDIARRLHDAGPGSGLLRGLALGDRQAIDDAGRAAFVRLGLAHALAVSGLHLAWVVAAGFALARAVLGCSAFLAARCDTRRWALLPAVLLGLAYAGLAGFGVPVRRASWLLVAAGIAILRRRPGCGRAALGGAALWILAREPDALFLPGAQLSFASVAALMLAGRRATRPEPAAGRAARAAHLVAATLRHSATAILATAPLLAWHGMAVSPVALVANLVALPWLGVAVLPAALIAGVAAALDAPGWEELARLAARLADATVRALESVARQLPAPERARPGAAWGAATLALAGLGLAASGTAARVVIAWAVALLIAWAPAAQRHPAVPRLLVLDVGQGDAVAVQGVRGAVLVDGGGAREGWDAGARRVVPALRALGVTRLDLVIASHGDLDHRGGLPSVLEALPVSELWLPFDASADPGFEALRRVARQRGVRVREAGRGSPLRRFGTLRVAPLWPPRGGSGSRNARSLVVRIESGEGRRVLLPGDLDAPAERALVASGADLRADVLVLPHHGSDSSSSGAFLDAVAARLAIASAPCRGRFGMPHRSVRERLAGRGTPLGWTGRDGALRVPLRGPLRISGTGRPARCR